MTAQELKNSVLQLAIQGKLVKQDPNDEPASVLLEKIKEEREKLIKEKKIKKQKYSEIYKDSSDNHYYEKFEDGTVNDITDEIPFDIPDSWTWTKLQNLSVLISDGTHKTPKYVSNGIPFISVKDISSGKLNFDNVKFITQEEHNNLIKRCKPEKNDILICRIGTLGKALKIETEIEFSIFVSLGLVKLLKRELADYIMYVINSGYGYNWIENNKVGGGTHTFKINLEDLRKMLIPIPPLKEQKRIIEILKSILPYIEKYNNTHNKLEKLNNTYKEELKKSILQYAIQGKLVKQDSNDEHAKVLINKILEEKRELIKTKQIKKENLSIIYKDSTDNQFYEKFDDGKIVNITDEIPFEIPANWCWTRLNNIMDVRDGTHNSPNYHPTGIPLVTSKNLSETGLNFENVKYISLEDSKKINERSRVDNGDILFAMIGSIGNPVIVKKEFEFSIKNMALLKNVYNININYIFIVLKFMQIKMKKDASGGVQKFVSLNYLRNFLIPFPPEKEQIILINKLNNIIKNIEIAQ